MNKLIYRCILLSLLGLLLSCDKEAQKTAFKKTDYAQQWLVVNYWATWCQPCIEELPALNEFYKTHRDKNVTVLGINFDGISSTAMQEFSKPFKLSFPLFSHFPLSDYQLTKPMVLPTTYIIAPDGTVKKTLVGPQDLASLTAALQTVIPTP